MAQEPKQDMLINTFLGLSGTGATSCDACPVGTYSNSTSAGKG